MADLPPDVRLWVGSDGPETEELQGALRRATRASSGSAASPTTEKHRRLRGADVFCAPSLGGESFGVVLLEAMAASTAIVATDLPGYRNVARPDRDALLVPPGDPVALAAALRRVLATGAAAATSWRRGRSGPRVLDGPLAERYLELYEQRRCTGRRGVGRVAAGRSPTAGPDHAPDIVGAPLRSSTTQSPHSAEDLVIRRPDRRSGSS